GGHFRGAVPCLTASPRRATIHPRAVPPSWRFPMRRRIVVVVAAVSLVAGAGLSGRAQDAKKDKEQLQGAWLMLKMERAGKTEIALGDLTFEGDTFTVKHGDQLVLKGTFTLDPSKTPKVIDLKVTEARREQDKGKEVHGIYELDKDTLKWCTAEPGGKDRPKNF